jgi:uncharacterized phage protein (TIGR02220 family)
MDNQKGWIKLHRKFLDWEWYDDTNVKVLFLHILLKANHEEKRWRGITIKRGQFISSYSTLAEEVGLSVQQVRTALDKLISTSEITKSSNSNYTVISVVNYDEYQSNQHTEQQTSNKRVTTTKNDKNEKNNNIYIEFVNSFNKIVGSNHRATKKVSHKFNARIKEGYKPEDIIKAVKRAKENDFLMGKNENKKRYLTPEYILREDKLDEWLNATSTTKSKKKLN